MYLSEILFRVFDLYLFPSLQLFQRVIMTHGVDWRNGAATTNIGSYSIRGLVVSKLCTIFNFFQRGTVTLGEFSRTLQTRGSLVVTALELFGSRTQFYKNAFFCSETESVFVNIFFNGGSLLWAKKQKSESLTRIVFKN